MLVDLVRMSRGLPPLYAPPTPRNNGQITAKTNGQITPLQRQILRRRQMLFREQLGELLRSLSDRKEFLDGLFQEMVRQAPEELKDRLKDEEADIRLVAVQAVADRRLHFEDTLIDLLDDPSPEVQEAARKALVRLSRGNDFGPARNPGASRLWTLWLLWQDIPGQPSPEWLAQKLRSSPADYQEWLLTQLREWPRQDGSSILARAIPLLTVDADPFSASQQVKAESSSQAKAEETEENAPQQLLRRALRYRLTKLSAEKLDNCLKDDDGEIRRAAADACGLCKEKANVPALVAALKDKEAAVSQTAHEALRSLTGQDFGPPPHADAARIEAAVASWLRWWQSQPHAPSASRGP
jgi:hypothetical protein